jgi:hypothetical protein
MCTWLMYGLGVLNWVVIPMKLVIPMKSEGVFAKQSEPRLNATRPLFGVERRHASKGQQLLIKLKLKLMPMISGQVHDGTIPATKAP